MVTASTRRNNPAAIQAKIEDRFKGLSPLHDRMDEDYAIWRLDNFEPDIREGIDPADAYTTNRPRVLAQKIISILASTELVIRIPDHTRQNKNVKSANDALEAFTMGTLDNADRRARRANGAPGVQSQLAWFSTIRGWRAAAQGYLRKRRNGETYEVIEPLDPRFLYIEPGDEEPLWSAYKTFWSRGQIRDTFPRYRFDETNMDDDEQIETVYHYWVREANPNYDPLSTDAYQSHPYVYKNGVLIGGQWAQALTDRFLLSFPVVAVSVDQMPNVTVQSPTQPSEKSDRTSIQDQGESIFAENRQVWGKRNRAMTYLMHMMAKQTDPQKLVYSVDGETVLDDSANQKGDEIPLSTARQESVELMQQADLARAGLALLQEIQTDETSGGVAPQGLGIIDTALSSVALRQLGTNLEHRIQPRLRAIESVLDGCLENIRKQFETGAFEPITVTGMRNDRTAFSSVIMPEDLEGHDNIIVSLKFTPPEDELIKIQAANQLMQPTMAGEPLASLEYVRTRVLNMESSQIISEQNADAQLRAATPLAQAWQRYEAAQKTGDERVIAIALDTLRLMALQHNVQVQAGITQLMQAMGQLPPMAEAGVQDTVDLNSNGQRQYAQSGQANNPANGAPPFVLSSGVGNLPSPDAGNNLGIPRNTVPTEPQLLGPNGEPIGFGGF